MRLVKYLAAAGVASRRASETIIRAGRVTVDGTPIIDPAHEVDLINRVALDGHDIEQPHERVVYALNKPPGVVSTASDPQGRPTVISLVPAGARLYPVGRLDIDTTGLILLTNDGDLAHRMTHPRFEVEKAYRATVTNPPVGDEAIARLRNGVTLDDGPSGPAKVRKLASDVLEITIHAGRKRQVRRMCQQVGHPLRRLERTRFGPLALGNLPRGAYRKLEPAEIELLSTAATGARRCAAGSSAAPAPPRAE